MYSQAFLEELKEFGKSYDLMGSGYKHREEQAKKRLSIVQDELLLLEAGDRCMRWCAHSLAG